MHWLTYLWLNYFWPSDLGNGPEAIQQSVLYAAIAVLFIPPIRKYFSRHIKSLHDKLDEHHKAQLAQSKKHHEALLRQAEDHHVKQLDLMKKHHAEHLLALQGATPKPKVTPIRKKPE